MFARNHKKYLVAVIILVVLLLATAACSNEGIKIERVSLATFAPKPIQVNVTQSTPPTKMTPGQKAAVVVDVKGLALSDMIQWAATRGKFEGEIDRTATTYVAPSELGPDNITCAITSNGKTTATHLPIIVVAQLEEELVASAPNPATPPDTAPAQAPPPGPFDIEDGGFVACGWMGDGESGTASIKVDPISREQPHTGATCQKWSYKPGPVGWAAVAWQFGDRPCNWGDKSGKDLSGRGFTRVTVWARGVPDGDGRTPKLQFKAGGNTNPTKKNQASYEVSGDFVSLTPEWRQYSLDIRGQDLSRVIGAFTWVIRAKDNPNGATFYLSEIAYQ